MPARIEATSVMELLKQSTQEHHKAVERALDLSNPHFTHSSYRQLLERFCGYYAPWEKLCESALDPELTGFFGPRLKTPLLEQDLVRLGSDPGQIPRCEHLPEIRNVRQALGSMYVVEGSTLGGRLLSRHFAGTLGIAQDSGGRFFAGYGDRTGLMWREFASVVEAHTDPDHANEAVEAAKMTFETLHHWLVRA